MKRRLFKGGVIAAVVAVGIGLFVAHGNSERKARESCANCRSFVHWLLDEYAAQHDGWYPKGGKDPLDSLAKCVKEPYQVRFFTSHAQAGRLVAQWEEKKTFSAANCCYRYVEGLRTNDPPGMVMLYSWQPTQWECSSHQMKEVGRVVCFHPPRHQWEFIPETEFQEKLAQTLAYLQEQGRKGPAQ
ncbi:MAG: hypothetical protein AB1705_09595 [Verrucomicrobiota bacterium]